MGTPIATNSEIKNRNGSLSQLRARYYDTTTSEFISPDPLEYVNGMSLFRGYFVGVGVDPSGEDWVDPVITKVRPESNCCSNPMPLWDYWNYSSVDECTAHILLMAALRPGGSLFAVSATVRAAIVKPTNTGNWAGLIAVIGAGYAARLRSGYYLR